MNDWNIQSRARLCHTCGRAFADNSTYHTVLMEQRSGFERLDVCTTCWDEQHRHGVSDRKGFVSHWQGTFTSPPPPAPEPIARDSAESLLRQLTELNDPAWQPAAFILAAMLERKRLLKAREQFVQNGRRIFVYEVPRTGEVLTVPDPGLRLDQLEQVQHDVSHLMEHGLPARAVDSAAPPIENGESHPTGPDSAPIEGAAGVEEASGATEGVEEEASAEAGETEGQSEEAGKGEQEEESGDVRETENEDEDAMTVRSAAP